MVITEEFWTDTRDFSFQRIGEYYLLYDEKNRKYINKYKSFAKMYEEIKLRRNGVTE